MCVSLENAEEVVVAREGIGVVFRTPVRHGRMTIGHVNVLRTARRAGKAATGRVVSIARARECHTVNGKAQGERGRVRDAKQCGLSKTVTLPCAVVDCKLGELRFEVDAGEAWRDRMRG